MVLVSEYKQEITGVQTRQEEVKLSFLAGDIILYDKNMTKFAKKIRKSEVNKFPRFKVNIQNVFGFLLLSDKQLETEAKYFKTYSVKNLKKIAEKAKNI